MFPTTIPWRVVTKITPVKYTCPRCQREQQTTSVSIIALCVACGSTPCVLAEPELAAEQELFLKTAAWLRSRSYL